MSSTRSEHLTLGHLPLPAVGSQRSGSSTATTSPTEPTAAAPLRSPFGPPGARASMAGNTRSGAGSPSHELGATGSSRIYASKRAREIQAAEGLASPWGPPTSGNSTPLRENIPESPTDGFPAFSGLPTPDSLPQARRPRAGTVPSRFSPGGAISGLGPLPSSLAQQASRQPVPNPYKAPSPSLADVEQSTNSNAALLSRLRAGSMPQRSPYNTGAAFGQPYFSHNNWASAGRERTSTLASIASIGSSGPQSPTLSQKDGHVETDFQMRTLDYLGLADTPQPPRAQLALPFLANISDLNKNRFRSYSVNAKEQYAADEDEEEYTGGLTHEQYQLQLQLAATNAQIQRHNFQVQQQNQIQATFARPRARASTAGVLDSPHGNSKLLRQYYPMANRFPDAGDMSESHEYEGLPAAVAAMNMGRSSSRNDHLSPDEPLEGPTRSLWLGSIPPSTTISTLSEMFKTHGVIVSVRVLTHKNCGFVNFEHLESAISAKNAMHGKEIFPGAGPIRINFAKPTSPLGTPGADGAFPSPSPDPFGHAQENGDNSGPATLISRPGSASVAVPKLAEMKSDILKIVADFGATGEDVHKITTSLNKAIQYDQYQPEIPAIQEPGHSRVHDAPKLREIRKRIDNNSCSSEELKNLAMDMIPEIAELASDYLGNTVVQKLFEHCSDDIRDAMLEQIAPKMAEIGVHKNGTWAAQKIIDVCKTPKQMSMITQNLQPYVVPLFLDQYGNYVLQCCLKFGSPFNDFIFEAMLTQMWEIAQGRYGARAMRACLESHHSTKEQQRMLAAAIALHSVQLATNANGALLLTWFLDTCTFPSRRTVLAPTLVPRLTQLCTHKVAYLTVLKVINQKAESEARDLVLKALFFSANDATLEAILADHACGATLIFKVLTTPFFDDNIRAPVVENVRNVLLRLKAQPAQGYKRLMDEVGLSTRNGSTGPREQSSHQSTERPRSNHSQANGHMIQPPQYGQYYQPMPQNAYEMGMDMQRTGSVESAGMPYTQYGLPNPLFANNVQVPQMSMQQLQYQQSMLARTAVPMNNYYPTMQSGFGAFGNASSDPFRSQGANPIQTPQMSGSPMLANSAYGPPGFGMYGGYNGMAGMPYMQQEQVNGRRGRVSGFSSMAFS